MAELGLVGLALILGFLGFAAVSGIRRGPTRSRGGALGAALAILAAGIVSAAIDWTWELSACFGLVVLAAALLTGPATLPKQPALSAVTQAVDGGRGRGSRTRPARFGLGVATLLVGWAAIWAGGTVFLTEVRLANSRSAASDPGLCVCRAGRARREHASAVGGGPPAPARPRRGAGRGHSSRQSRPQRGDPARPRRLAALVRARAVGGQGGRRRRGAPGAGACSPAQPAGSVLFSVTARSEPPSPSQAGLRAWTHFGGGPGRERWMLPFAAVCGVRAWSWPGSRRRSRGSIGDGCSWGSVPAPWLLPCGLLALQRQARSVRAADLVRADVPAPLRCPARVGPRARELHLHGAADLADLHQDARRRSAGGSGLRDRLPDPGGRVAGIAASASPGAGLPPSADLVDARVRCGPRGVRGLLRRGARVA